MTFDIGFSNAAAEREFVEIMTYSPKPSARRAGEAQCLGDMPLSTGRLQCGPTLNK